MAVDGAFVEHHDVLGKGARLIGEDVLHLAQLLIQGGGTGLCRRPLLHAEHLLIPVDEVAVAQTDDFHTALGIGGKAWEAGREGIIPPTRALAAGTRPGEKRKWRRHLGTGTWMGRGREACRWSCSCTQHKSSGPDPTRPS